MSRDVRAPAQALWDVLADGWLYPLWVVGAARMRHLDEHWPQVGTRLHHSVGRWPLLLDDRTEVLEVEPMRRLKLRAHAWPAGAAEVVIEIEQTGAASRVHLREDVLHGPASIVPKPLRQLVIAPRNRESLHRLALLAEGRHR